MAIRTIAPIAVSVGANVLAFEEGALLTATYVVEGTLVDGDGYVLPFNPNVDVTSKTINGFTITPAVSGTFSAVVVEYGTATPDGSQNIVSLTEIKEYLNITGSDNDTFLSRWLTYVSDAIEKHTCSIIKQRNFTFYEIGSGTRELYPSKIPIISLATPDETDIQYKVDPTDANWTTLEADTDNIIIDPNSPWKITMYEQTFPWNIFPNIKLVLTCGYSVIPQEIAMVCIEAVAEKFKESDRGGHRLGIGTKSLGEAGGNLSDSFYQLSDRHKRMLQPYKFFL